MWPKNVFTRFEVARLLGARSLQIALGAPVLVKVNSQDPIEIAKEEFKQYLLPITIKRRLPNNKEMSIDVKAAIRNWMEEGREL